MEQLVVYFSSVWYPAAGLAPLVSIRERNGTIRVLNQVCKAIPNAIWFYSYDFAEYNPDKQYLFRFDWTGVLPATDRWISGVNDLDSYSNKVTRWRTVAATTPYDDSTMQIKLANIEQMVGKDQPKAEKIDLTKIEKRLKSIEEKKIELPKPIDLTEVHKKIDNVAKAIQPWITPEQVNEVIQQREDNKAINELINVHKPQVDADMNAIKQLIDHWKQQRKQELLDRRAIKALSRNQK